MKKFELKPEDFYRDSKGNLVFTEIYHLKRGHCCTSACRHCPYNYRFDPSTPQELQKNINVSSCEELSADDLIEKYSDFMKE